MRVRNVQAHRDRPGHGLCLHFPSAVEDLRGVWFEELKFNLHGSIFVLFDKKFSIIE
jgi:hypothetical protein